MVSQQVRFKIVLIQKRVVDETDDVRVTLKTPIAGELYGVALYYSDVLGVESIVHDLDLVALLRLLGRKA